jgi:hypothetical protein
MSAIAKPYVHFTNSTTPSQYVSVEHVLSVDALDIPAVPNQPSSTAKYQIVVTYQDPDNKARTSIINFLTSAARNTSLGNFKTAMSAPIA